MWVPYQDLSGVHHPIYEQMEEAFKQVLHNEWYINGMNCNAFEKEFAQYCDAKFCVGVANGLDAIRLSLHALNIGYGSEVIVCANTFIATILAVSQTGAKPILVDADAVTFNIDLSKIEEKITKRTRAIIPVHLYGRSVDMNQIMDLANGFGIKVIEDAAQAHGATWCGKKAGSRDSITAFSFYPGKNLGALGDGGAIVTSDREVYERLRKLANYGADKKYIHELRGFNSRLDEVQAAFLRIKLQYLDNWNRERREIAEFYEKELDRKYLEFPEKMTSSENVYHIFPILYKKRDELSNYLKEYNIETNIHYPKPIYRQEAYVREFEGQYFPVTDRICQEELSLPIFPGMSRSQMEYVVEKVNQFLRK